MCKKFFQSILGGGAKKPQAPATARPGGDEGQEATILAPEALDNAGDAMDPNGGRVRLSGRRRVSGQGVAGLSI